MIIPYFSTLKDDEGFLYLVKDINLPLFKIGWTKNPHKRMRSYVSHNPNLNLIKAWIVPSKKYEKLVTQYIIINRIAKPAKVKGSKEWLEGIIFTQEIETIIKEMIQQYESL
jgi:hypothetical protein